MPQLQKLKWMWQNNCVVLCLAQKKFASQTPVRKRPWRGFLSANPGAAEVTESARLFWPAQPPVVGPGPGVALLTGAADTDGFYYACVEKQA